MPDPTDRLRPGQRVVVRYRLAPPGTGPTLTDALGELLRADERTVTVQTRTGPVTIERELVVAAKEVPPRPSRRGAPHLAVGVEELERAMVDGWAPVERAGLGEWVLRAAGGFSRRANSVLAVGDPGREVTEAVEQAERWYAGRGLPAVASLAGPVGFDAADDPVGAVLLARGYQAGPRVRVMTADARAAQAGRGEVRVEVSGGLTDEWLDAYRLQRQVVAGATEAVLTGSPEQLFAAVRRDRAVVALARLSLAHRWGGLSCLWVAPGHRRRGLAAALTGELAARADRAGARSLWLQVEQHNDAATALYGGLGFTAHHEYAYLARPR